MAADGTKCPSTHHAGSSGHAQRAVAEEQIWFSAYLELDVYRSERPYMIPRQGGDPVRLHDAFGATPVPGEDGQMFFVRGGYYDGWARRHFRSANALMCGV